MRTRTPGEDVFLSYFGSGDPRYYHLHAKQLEFLNNFHEDSPYVELGPGLYCIGATMLEQVYSPVRGPWTLELEKEYPVPSHLRAHAQGLLPGPFQPRTP